MQTCRRKVNSERREHTYLNYQELLAYEKERSERNNHFFVLCGLEFIVTPAEDLIDLLQKELRASDYIFQVPGTDEKGRISSKIGLLLPETDSSGGGIVFERMNQLCCDRRFLVQMGLAIYPDDATVPGEILKKAFKADQPGGIGRNSTAGKRNRKQ
jgi:hypothetical protein